MGIILVGVGLIIGWPGGKVVAVNKSEGLGKLANCDIAFASAICFMQNVSSAAS